MRKRIYKFDNVKILLIFFVVLGHCTELFVDKYSAANKTFIFIYSFHMPLFIFISGLFQKKIDSFKNVNYYKIAYYLFLSISMMIMLAFIDFLFGNEVSFSLLSGNGVYWYLIVLSVYLFLLPLINKINIKFLFIFSVLLALAIGYDNSIGDYLFLSRIIVFFPFFCLGYYFSNKKELLLKITDNKFSKVISFVIIVLFIFICYSKIEVIYSFRGLFTARNSYSVLEQIKKCSCFHRLLAYMISSIMGFSILCLLPNRKITVITNMGKRTLQIYVFHQMLINIINNIGIFDALEKEFTIYFIYVLMGIAFIITLFSSIRFFKWIMDKFYKVIFITEEV